MSVLVNEGRAAIATAIANRPLHLAWGEGDPTWDDNNPPAPPVDTNVLESEVGRRALHSWEYCTPDENGDIQTTTGRYSISADPTPHLYLSFKYDYEDASDKVIREAAVFMDTEFVAGLPAGQKYFQAAQVTNAGLMLSLERLYIPRTPSSRETIDLVITF
tara:strand:+ start:861 stop:1343 length:483 start_codon:yes stop_codon:yes gene_type:complete